MKTEEELYKILENTDALLKKRNASLALFKSDPRGLDLLFFYTFKKDDSIQAIASYLMLDYLQSNLLLIIPYIDELITNSKHLTNESVKRIVSRILVLVLQRKGVSLSSLQKEQVGELALGWLVDYSKVATESNAMDILICLKTEYPDFFILGREVIVANFYTRSIAYQKKAKKYLAYS